MSLRKLKAGTSYELKFSENATPYYFRTMPADTEEEAVRIAFGGDTMHSKKYMEEMNRQVLQQDPHCVVIGGDLAYANGEAREVERWYDWFDAWNSSLITKDRRLVPVIVTIGNHEVIGGYYDKHEDYKPDYEKREKIAPYFYSFFVFPGHSGYKYTGLWQISEPDRAGYRSYESHRRRTGRMAGCAVKGTAPREVHDVEKSWYLQKAESVRHFILMTIQGEELNMTMIDKNEQQIDSYSFSPGR